MTSNNGKQLMLGNKAVARGLFEAGVCFISSYPGTPSTEVTEEAAKFLIYKFSNHAYSGIHQKVYDTNKDYCRNEVWAVTNHLHRFSKPQIFGIIK